MNPPSLLKSAIITTFLLCSFINSDNSSQTTTQPQISAAEQKQLAELAEFAEALLSAAFNALQKLENKLTEVALLVKKGAIKKGANPKTVRKILTENKMLINGLLGNQAGIMSVKDPFEHLRIAHFVAEFSRAFTHYLDQQILTGFKKAKVFNINKFVASLQEKEGKTRSRLDHLDPMSLAKTLSKTDAKLRILDQTVQRIGLTWYNKAARKFDSCVVNPAVKWHIPTIATYALGAAALGIYSLWHYGDHFKKNENMPLWLRDFVKNTLLADKRGPLGKDFRGFPYIIGAETDDSHNDRFASNSESFYANIPHDAAILAVTDWAVTNYMTNNHPAMALGATWMFTSLYKTWQTEVYPVLIQKRDNAWNLLRGGEYLNTFQPGLVAMDPQTTFDDMVGQEEVKEAFRSLIEYVSDPEKLMRLEAMPEKGWLLTGPTRTGKSFSVQCLCGEIKRLLAQRGMSDKVKYYDIPATLINEFGVKSILEEVYRNAPAIIFLDEIDLLGLQRVGNNKLLHDFLTAMQSSMNADPSKIVIVIAATNNPENLDKALRQNGRFGKEIRFEYPSRKYRTQFILRELSNMALNLKEFNIDVLVDKTDGKSFEDLKRVVRNAMTRSWMYGISLTQELLEESIDTELRGIMKHNRKELSVEELRIIATHFAGMGIAGLTLQTHQKLDEITIYPRMMEIKEEGVWQNFEKKDEKEQQKKIEYGAYLTRQSHDTINAKNKMLIMNEAILLIAGFAAEELLLGSCGFSCHPDDSKKAYKLIEDLVFGGLPEDKLAKNIREELKSKAYALFKECHSSALNLLKEHQNALIAIVDELLKKQLLSAKEIRAIVDRVEGKSAALADQFNDIFEEDEDDDEETIDNKQIVLETELVEDMQPEPLSSEIEMIDSIPPLESTNQEEIMKNQEGNDLEIDEAIEMVNQITQVKAAQEELMDIEEDNELLAQ
jgi:AAA+ superfamily predicted ATPase